MANPNIVNVTEIYGKTTGVNLTTTSATTILSNAVDSGKCLKVNVLNVSNYLPTPATVTVGYYNAANVGGTLFEITGDVSVPGNSTLNVIDKTSQYYLEENSSLGATASSSSTLCVTCSYEEIS